MSFELTLSLFVVLSLPGICRAVRFLSGGPFLHNGASAVAADVALAAFLPFPDYLAVTAAIYSVGGLFPVEYRKDADYRTGVGAIVFRRSFFSRRR